MPSEGWCLWHPSAVGSVPDFPGFRPACTSPQSSLSLLYHYWASAMLNVMTYVPISALDPFFANENRSATFGLGPKLPGVGVIVHELQIPVPGVVQVTVDQPVPE